MGTRRPGREGEGRVWQYGNTKGGPGEMRRGAGIADSVAAVQPPAGRPVLARALPFATYMAFLAVTPLLAGWAPGLDERWLYPLKAAAVVAVLAFFRRSFDELKAVRLSLRSAVLALATGALVFVVWINFDRPWLTVGSAGAGFDARSADGGIDWLLASTRLAGAALVVPVMEELFWRSLVMRWLDRADFLALSPGAVGLRALLASSLAFGFEHRLWAAGIIAGLVYGQLYRRSGNLWLAIAAHGVTNGLLGAWVLWSGQWQFW
jgi:CAAX prenyl protease-like protein